MRSILSFLTRNKPARLYKKKTFREKLAPYGVYMNAELVLIIAFMILFIGMVVLAIGETSWYNIPNGGV